MDFVADQLADGRRFRSLTVVDIYTRECLAMLAAKKMGSQEVSEALGKVRVRWGVFARLRSDHGPEFMARELQTWLGKLGRER